jgi:EAL domain-containing protein (putative c-di-GMP-specific phosphodiesterase class I)/FixJ family two-component response regulator
MSAGIDIGNPFEAREQDAAETCDTAALERALQLALANDELRLLYQPVIDVATDRIIGAEALLRWEHPVWGTLSPRRFLAVAETSGLTVAIGDWAMQQACRDLRTWDETGCAGLRIDLNLSPAQFRDPHLADKLMETAAHWHIDPSRLCLDITESTLLQDPEWAVALLRHCKETGAGIAVADYGAGRLPIGELRRFAIDRVKLGRLLVRDMETERDDADIVKAIVASARCFGWRSSAEGVENDVQCQLLRELSCDEMQGHLFYRALPADQIAEHVRTSQALADHLARLQTPQRTLLLVDDEANILAALKRLLRRDGYQILTANGGREALDVLKQHEVDVIMSDQRMPGMTGTEFLRVAKDLYPDTVRMVLSGYTELQSVTDAINEGAIYKFLMKPWDDAQLRAHVAEAFRRKELADENRRLALQVRSANQELATANLKLEELLRQQQLEIQRDAVSMGIVHEVLHHVPLPVIGLDEDDMVAFVNSAAQALFADGSAILGCDAHAVMPELIGTVTDAADGEMRAASYKGKLFKIAMHGMGKGSEARGKLLILSA